VVDAANYSLDLFNSEAAYSQIAYGDIILLNKADLVDEADLDALEKKFGILRKNSSHYAIASANPLILSVGLFESDKYFDQHSDHGHDHHHDHGHDHHDHDHHSHHLENDGFTSLSFQSDQPLAIRKFQYFLDKQLPLLSSGQGDYVV